MHTLAARTHLELGFFPRFTNSRLQQRFTKFYLATRYTPRAFVRRLATTNQQHGAQVCGRGNILSDALHNGDADT